MNQCNLERIHKITEAAKSGKYTKAIGKLKDPEKENCFCWLGLACEIYRLETGKGEWSGSIFITGEDKEVNCNYFDMKEYGTTRIPEEADKELPDTVRKWYGFNDNNPFDIIAKNDLTEEEAVETDERFWSLEEISEFVEAECKK